MPSQFFGLNIAYTGLLASNAAMNTTSNNIANVQTEGYSRQQVTQQASMPCVYSRPTAVPGARYRDTGH